MSTLLKRMVSRLKDSYLANRLIPPTIVDRLGRLQAEIWLRAYLRERRPHTEGYTIYKEQLLRRTLRDGNLIDRFRDKRSLPPEFGVGIDERCVEYPWLISRLPVASGRLLDAGSTLNFELLLDLPALQNKMVHILTLAPERDCFWQRGVSYIFHDVRDIPIRDAYYDTVVSVSTIEHVGCDVSVYSSSARPENSPTDFVLAVRELRRVLRPGGTFLFTVPFGVARHLGWMQQFDSALLQRAIDAFGAADEEERSFYLYSARGWDVATESDCRNADYVEPLRGPHTRWPSPFPMQPDNAANARAVACVRLTKSA